MNKPTLTIEPDKEKLLALVAEIRNFTERKMETEAADEIQRHAARELEEVTAKLEARIGTL